MDRPVESKGEAFNVGDDAALTLRQWTQAIAAGLGHELEIVSMPIELATPAWPLAFSIGQAPQCVRRRSSTHPPQPMGAGFPLVSRPIFPRAPRPKPLLLTAVTHVFFLAGD